MMKNLYLALSIIFLSLTESVSAEEKQYIELNITNTQHYPLYLRKIINKNCIYDFYKSTDKHASPLGVTDAIKITKGGTQKFYIARSTSSSTGCVSSERPGRFELLLTTDAPVAGAGYSRLFSLACQERPGGLVSQNQFLCTPSGRYKQRKSDSAQVVAVYDVTN